MPYSAIHKEKTRARIVESARALFNRKGFESVSIDEIMKCAGLTRGGFYNHFKTKEELFVETIAGFGRRTRTDQADNAKSAPPSSGVDLVRHAINAYLSRAHLDDIDCHCPLMALPSDVSRASSSVKDAYRGLLEGMARLFGMAVPDADAKEARTQGLALAALCIGGMALARIFDDATLSNQIREAARIMALKQLA